MHTDIAKHMPRLQRAGWRKTAGEAGWACFEREDDPVVEVTFRSSRRPERRWMFAMTTSPLRVVSYGSTPGGAMGEAARRLMVTAVSIGTGRKEVEVE